MLTNLSPETFSRLWQSFSGLVGYDDRLTRGRSRVRLSAEVEVFFLSLHFTHCYLLIVTNYTNFNKNYKKGGQGGFEPPTSRTQSENHTPRPLALMCELNLEGFEPPTFGSGIRRATIAP